MRTRKITVEVYEHDRFRCKKVINAPLTKDFKRGWMIDIGQLDKTLQAELPYSCGRKGMEIVLVN